MQAHPTWMLKGCVLMFFQTIFNDFNAMIYGPIIEASIGLLALHLI